MSAFDVLSRHGTAALLRFLGSVALFVALHLLRQPFLLAARLLEAGMRRVDARLTASVTAPGSRPRDSRSTRPCTPASAGV